jgi:hypothetical protein
VAGTGSSSLLGDCQENNFIFNVHILFCFGTDERERSYDCIIILKTNSHIWKRIFDHFKDTTRKKSILNWTNQHWKIGRAGICYFKGSYNFRYGRFRK